MGRKHGGMPIGIRVCDEPGDEVLQDSLLYGVEIFHHYLLPAFALRHGWSHGKMEREWLSFFLIE
jgi:hypothetical protein